MFISLQNRKSGQNRIFESPQSSQSIEVGQQMKISHPEVPGIDENLFKCLWIFLFLLFTFSAV